MIKSEWGLKYEKRYPSYAFRVYDKNLASAIDEFISKKGWTKKQQFGDYLLDLFKREQLEYSYKLKED